MVIDSRKSAEEWARGQSRVVIVAFAARNALRALPGLATADAETLSGIALPVLRAMLTSAVAAVRSTAEVKLIASAASAASATASTAASNTSAAPSAAFFASAAAHSAAYSAASITPSAAAAAADDAGKIFKTGISLDRFWKEVDRDASNLETQGPDSVFRVPLWPDRDEVGNPGRRLKRLRTFWRTDADIWEFWDRWYAGMLKGEPLEWEMQEAVALIPDEEWKKGSEQIARLIEEIEARFVGNSIRERVQFSATRNLTLVPQPFGEERQLGYLLDTVQDALELATSGLRNELPKDSYQARLLRRTFIRYANDPQRIEMDFERARVSLVEDMAVDEIPASPANRDLIQSLSDAAGAIRESNPEITETRERLNRIRLGQLSHEDASRISDVARQVADISEGVLRDDLLEDRFSLPGVRRDDGAPDPVVPLGAAQRNMALEAQAAQLRVYSRLSKVWLFLKANDREVGVVGSIASIIGLIVAVFK